MKYGLTAAQPSDLPWLEELRRVVYRDLFFATWGAWDEERHKRHFAACIERGHIFVIEVSDERVGMIQTFDEPDAVEIGELQIDPKHQNRGIGTRVLADVIAQAHGRGISVRLTVALKNEAALRFYERQGFTRVGRSETHHHMESSPRLSASQS